MQQVYSERDDYDHIRSLLPAFADPRYIRVNDRALFLVYRVRHLPNPSHTAAIWRDEVRKAGLGDLFLCKVESFADCCDHPALDGFDAAVEFAPDERSLPPPARKTSHWQWRLRRLRLVNDNYFLHSVFDYPQLVANALRKPTPDYLRFPCVCPSWDNTARRNVGATIMQGATPLLYQQWLSKVVLRQSTEAEQNRIVFINAWNEWAEGNHLEPCERWGRAYLTATRRALDPLCPEKISAPT
jgi:hypothetical protein